MWKKWRRLNTFWMHCILWFMYIRNLLDYYSKMIHVLPQRGSLVFCVTSDHIICSVHTDAPLLIQHYSPIHLSGYSPFTSETSNPTGGDVSQQQIIWRRRLRVAAEWARMRLAQKPLALQRIPVRLSERCSYPGRCSWWWLPLPWPWGLVGWSGSRT